MTSSNFPSLHRQTSSDVLWWPLPPPPGPDTSSTQNLPNEKFPATFLFPFTFNFTAALAARASRRTVGLSPVDAAFVIVIVIPWRRGDSRPPAGAHIKPDRNGAVYGNIFQRSLFTGYHHRKRVVNLQNRLRLAALITGLSAKRVG